MVIFNIIIHDENKVEEIMHTLFENKYAKTIQLDREIKNYYDKNNELDLDETTKLSFMTKALLYSEIEKILIEKYGEENFVMYAIPIVHMNEKNANDLRSYYIKQI